MSILTNGALPRLAKIVGRHRDGQGLFFRVIGGGKSYFVYRYRIGGREREISLGPYPETSLDQARAEHARLRAKVKGASIDPLEEKRIAKTVAPRTAIPSFGQIADQYVATHEADWKNAKHRWQWRHTLTVYCAAIRETPVDLIDTAAILGVLQPLWASKQATAARLRGRIEQVIDAARALGHIDTDKANPARWKGHLDHLLSKRRGLTRGHHPALAYADIPALMAKLRRSPGTAAKALMFTILTAARTGEVLGMQFNEIDFEAAVWTVPPDRTKMGKEHRVPLSDAALSILRAQEKGRGKKQVYVFESPIQQGAKVHRDTAHHPLSGMAMRMVMQRLKVGEYTVHGTARASFRSWCSDTGVAFEVAEASLAHVAGNDVVRAYQRSDLLERRRPVMTAWAEFLVGEVEAKVVSIGAGRKR
jgi:integrase